MSAVEVSSFQDSLPPGKRPKDGETLARQLVQANKLTKYQAQVVYQGKVKGLIFGEYVVLDKLGEGGMGVVLKAEHRRMKRVVAVKMISTASLKSPDAVKRFYREVEAAAKLEHPNIVAAHDASEHEGVHYLVMQFVDGKDLSAIITEKGPLPVAQAVDYIIQAARGLQYAHEQGIIHRDIKPANLLVDRKGTVKILDMGLARVAGLADTEDKDRLTATGQVMGTLDYMAPEQAMDTHHVDARADIYSLGCTLYRLLTGEVLFKCDSLAKIIWAHQQSPIPSLCKALSDVPPQLDTAFQKMVAKKPEDRQQSMTEVIAALETCVGKRSAAATSLGEEPTDTFQAADNLSFLQGESPRRLATASKRKAEKLAAATLVLRAAAGETSKQLASDEGLLTVWRKKKTLITAVGCGLLGVIGMIALAVTIRIHHPDGKETVVTAANGSKVTINEKGDVDVAVKAEVAKPVAAVYGPDAPPPAVAPFDAAKAKQYQEAWAKYLGTSPEMTNSIGMNFVLIPPGEFLMGSTPEEQAWAMANRVAPKEVEREGWQPRQAVTTPGFWLGRTEVTVGQWRQFVDATGYRTEAERRGNMAKPKDSDARMGATGALTWRNPKPGFLLLDNHPVTWISWNDAVAFCNWLNNHEHQAARLPEGLYIRLPTEAEWEFACRGGTQTKFWWGEAKEDGEGRLNWNVNHDGPGPVAPVAVDHFGSRGRNPFGLADMLANVREWCLDEFDAAGSYAGVGIGNPSQCVLRGGCFFRGPGYARCAFRELFKPFFHAFCTGFRVCCGPKPRPMPDAAGGSSPRVFETTGKPFAIGAQPPPPAVAPFDATRAKQHQEAWAKYLGVPVEETNSIGMKLALIPPGEFEMGSTPEEIVWALEEGKKNREMQWYFISAPSESPRHRVTISAPFYLAMYPVTQAEYEKVMGVNPSAFTETPMNGSVFNPPLPDGVKTRETDAKKVAGKDTSRHPVETVDWEGSKGSGIFDLCQGPVLMRTFTQDKDTRPPFSVPPPEFPRIPRRVDCQKSTPRGPARSVATCLTAEPP